MRKTFLLIFLSLSCLSYAQDGGVSSAALRLLSADDIIAGRTEAAYEKLIQAAEELEGISAQECHLKALQLKLELGRYEDLPRETLPLVTGGLSPEIVRAALVVEIHSMIRLGWDSQALGLMERQGEFLSGDPSAALGLSDAYDDMGMAEEAKRLQWIIKRDFPQSPEALILTGQAERHIKPSLILP